MAWPVSDHFNGKTFFNPGVVAERGLREVFKWKMNSKPVPWPDHVDVVRQPLPAPPTGEGICATWIGHSTFLLRTAGLTVITDPQFSRTAGPASWLGAKRTVPPAIPLEELPKVDLVLLSHDHFDHCDLPSLRFLARRDKSAIIAPLGHGGLLKGAGFGDISELDWWETALPAPGAEVTLVPARHWCRRSPFGTNIRLWGGFMMRAGGRLTYFVGDSGYEAGLFSEIGSRCGRPDLALIPIGAYEPRWFMSTAHMDPAEAVQVHRDVGARRSLAMHWGTFQLTDEGREDPLRELAQALSGGEDFTAIEPGASVLT
jgi:L-ascorbate metabolism protein UlaG (beta-lactamase superfamily)